jgi:hypothetical protein
MNIAIGKFFTLSFFENSLDFTCEDNQNLHIEKYSVKLSLFLLIK